MAARYLLDTNVVSDFVRGEARVQARLKSTPPPEIAVSAITVMQTTYGLAAEPMRARKLRPVIDAMYASVELLPFSIEDAQAAGAVRAALRGAGRPIGPYDALLAGSALTRGLILVTANVDEFSRVAGLLVENWREAG